MNVRDSFDKFVRDNGLGLADLVWIRAAYLAAWSAAREEAGLAVYGLDELSVAADWDNSDDIAHSVKTACAAAIRSRLDAASRDGGV